MRGSLLLAIVIIGAIVIMGPMNSSTSAQNITDSAETEIATFAGGCFWCMQPPFDKTKGVKDTVVGYSGGTEVDPTYEKVAYGKTSHFEAIQVEYDPEQVSYSELLDIFWRNVDPLQPNGQFCDIGKHYRTAVFYHNEEQQRLAEESVKTLNKTRFDGGVVTEILPFGKFYRAEEYHQDYYKKNPIRYQMYRAGCGRDKRTAEIWGG